MTARRRFRSSRGRDAIEVWTVLALVALVVVGVLVLSACSSLPPPTDVNLTATGISADFPDPADLTREETEKARIRAETERVLARECYRTLQVGGGRHFLCPGMSPGRTDRPDGIDAPAAPDAAWTPSGDLLARLKADEGPMLATVQDGHVCHGHAVQPNGDASRFAGRTMTAAECHALLIEDVHKARVRALSAIDCGTETCVELCYYRGCNQWGARYGTETRGADLVAAVRKTGTERAGRLADAMEKKEER